MKTRVRLSGCAATRRTCPGRAGAAPVLSGIRRCRAVILGSVRSRLRFERIWRKFLRSRLMSFPSAAAASQRNRENCEKCQQAYQAFERHDCFSLNILKCSAKWLTSPVMVFSLSHARDTTSRTFTDPGGLLSACFQPSFFVASNCTRLRLRGQMYSYRLPASAVFLIAKNKTCRSPQLWQVFEVMAAMRCLSTGYFYCSNRIARHGSHFSSTNAHLTYWSFQLN